MNEASESFGLLQQDPASDLQKYKIQRCNVLQMYFLFHPPIFEQSHRPWAASLYSIGFHLAILSIHTYPPSIWYGLKS